MGQLVVIHNRCVLVNWLENHTLSKLHHFLTKLISYFTSLKLWSNLKEL